MARARAHPVHKGSSSLPGWSNEIGQPHLLKDVPLHRSLLLIPVGRLDRAQPSEPAFAVLGPGEEQHSPGRAGPPSERTGLQTAVPPRRRRGCQGGGAGPEQLGLPQRGAEKCAEHGHSSPLPWGNTQRACNRGARKGEDEAQLGGCQVGMVGRKPRSKSRQVEVPASLQARGRGVSIVVCSAVL